MYSPFHLCVTEPFINCEMHQGFSLRSEGLRAISHWSCCLIASSVVQVLQTSNRPPRNRFYTMRGSASVAFSKLPSICACGSLFLQFEICQSPHEKPHNLQEIRSAAYLVSERHLRSSILSKDLGRSYTYHQRTRNHSALVAASPSLSC